MLFNKAIFRARFRLFRNEEWSLPYSPVNYPLREFVISKTSVMGSELFIEKKDYDCEKHVFDII